MSLSLIVPAYSYPSPTTYWDGVISAAGVVKMVIANPASGPGTTVDTNYQAVIARSQAAGIKVLGYVDTSYNAVTVATFEANVDKWRTLYGITDIFIDQVSALLTDVSYYTTICNYIRAHGTNTTILLNHGAVPDQSYASIGDILCTFEGDGASYASYSPPSWITGSTYPSTKFYNIIYNSSASNFQTVVARAQSKNTGYLFVTDDVLANPYDVLPTYWSSEVATTNPAALTDLAILDLFGIGARSDGFRYEVLSGKTHGVIGSLQPSIDSPPTITNDTTASAFRTCSGLQVNAATLASINPLTERLKVSLILENGSVYPLGVFMFADDVRTQFSWGTQWTPSLVDETFIVDQPLDQSYGLAPGQSIMNLVNTLVAPIGLAAVDFSQVQDQLATTVVGPFSAGTSRSEAIVTLIKMLGGYPPFFSNSGVYTALPIPAPGTFASLRYDQDGRIIYGTPQTTNSLYRAPNRYQVIQTSSTTAGFVGTFDIPDTAPNSFASTGIRVVSQTTQDGIPSQAVANQMAYAEFLLDQNSYIGSTFSSTADPRHDTFNLVALFGITFQEQAWSLVCSSGGLMTHTLAGYYAHT